MEIEHYMQIAFSLAQGVAGQTSPNPPVGSVVVNHGRVVGMGAHLRAGERHAERVALDMAGKESVGADLYVTLEPCSHTGKTSPCTEAILQAGISRVYISSLDPNPLVSGSGIQRLRDSGVEVQIEVCTDLARELYQPFFHFIQTKQPHVTLKTAMTLDGKIAAFSGHSKWVTSEQSRLDVHRLRHVHDAILTGSKTILHDNPLLTTRLPQGGLHPIRVILDTQLSTPVTSQVIQNADAPTWIFCGSTASKERELSFLPYNHVEVFRMNVPAIAVSDVLEQLGARGIMTLLVEGGSSVNASFLQADAVDRIITYMAPRLLGGADSLTPIGGINPALMSDAKDFVFVTTEQLGPDLKVTAVPKGSDSYVHRNH
ncbi:bifunctional diaminohydroxyphosphoribosylaminopyrimidine deaminase/5-amino-6-(5-phosphoribosylamino)uracil reductase RibD [Sporosarcina sp. BI001-red]|uniref:bifunctional diaminohydroxyphosphoribosylaminopyrimidine deaminase/5-amino-6-(5-phosphoribosylamino)uracil reductase RibD n=1 Tax=Sporosarcina sp. BI001-red TaxID=2282866 RepID=UPI000E25F774|nr:bifunctional diaminohydroxyphosphoribosylaminopyrimidine deaminase/5-amino-6-(5-phosphoribosylamino)uracil reductase RibD [Sporosarcina sp. BI001-red]REB08088.1 bifunctional diaminohydroxyphosphoribosylaminopyrimidine deaminase/5-amino-6-(5-phosphoribosylamino)uracil reductase RibD [Sporosarcina sp. BI001-red]